MLLLIVRKNETKETLVHGIGMRFAVANWIQAAWAVCFVRIGAEIMCNANATRLSSCSRCLRF